MSLDIFWLRDDDYLGDMDNLPEPEEIVENLEAGLQGFRQALASLEAQDGSAESGEVGGKS